MKKGYKYDLLIIGGGISACVFASNYLKNNITKKVGLIEVGRGLGGRSSTRISKRFKGWKLNHGSPSFNISNSSSIKLFNRGSFLLLHILKFGAPWFSLHPLNILLILVLDLPPSPRPTSINAIFFLGLFRR